MYNAHPYFPLKNLGKKVRIIHGKIRWSLGFGFFIVKLRMNNVNFLTGFR